MSGMIAGAGVGISMLSGALEEMGVEGTESLTTLGNGLTLVGSLGSALGPVVTNIVGKLVEGGMSTAAAWGWVALVAVGIVAIVAAVMDIA